MDGALKRLHLADHKQRTDVLSESVIASPGGIKLLKLLQFHFQVRDVFSQLLLLISVFKLHEFPRIHFSTGQ